MLGCVEIELMQRRTDQHLHDWQGSSYLLHFLECKRTRISTMATIYRRYQALFATISSFTLSNSALSVRLKTQLFLCRDLGSELRATSTGATEALAENLHTRSEDHRILERINK